MVAGIASESAATEVNLSGAGFIDVLLVSEHGRLIIVECKLWRNPQARREVVGQILDYARELARYGYDDLQRVISSRVGRRGNVLYDLAREAGSTMSEADFGDRVSRDLAAGRFLLLIAGDGITEGTQRIGEYLGAQAGLAFDFGLIEIAEYRFVDPDTGAERRIVQPRLLARTVTIDRFVIRNEAPGTVVETIAETAAPRTRSSSGSSGSASGTFAAWNTFRDAFIAGVRFDDPGQMPPRNGGNNWMRLPLPGTVGVTLYRSTTSGNIGAFLRFIDADGMAVLDELLADRDAIEAEFAEAGLTGLQWRTEGEEKVLSITTPSPAPWDAAREEEQREWLGRAANQFVNSLRPRLSRISA
ncbi:hypothetical protein [Novosphingobium sp.]|uniref:hypothetical protein n=1 Tax=Novosphingobium sp. TaxID=1874826 RepID=UPI003D129A7C